MTQALYAHMNNKNIKIIKKKKKQTKTKQNKKRMCAQTAMSVLTTHHYYITKSFLPLTIYTGISIE
jgi:hypothetical protein